MFMIVHCWFLKLFLSGDQICPYSETLFQINPPYEYGEWIRPLEVPFSTEFLWPLITFEWHWEKKLDLGTHYKVLETKVCNSLSTLLHLDG